MIEFKGNYFEETISRLKKTKQTENIVINEAFKAKLKNDLMLKMNNQSFDLEEKTGFFNSDFWFKWKEVLSTVPVLAMFLIVAIASFNLDVFSVFDNKSVSSDQKDFESAELPALQAIQRDDFSTKSVETFSALDAMPSEDALKAYFAQRNINENDGKDLFNQDHESILLADGKRSLDSSQNLNDSINSKISSGSDIKINQIDLKSIGNKENLDENHTEKNSLEKALERQIVLQTVSNEEVVSQQSDRVFNQTKVDSLDSFVFAEGLNEETFQIPKNEQLNKLNLVDLSQKNVDSNKLMLNMNNANQLKTNDSEPQIVNRVLNDKPVFDNALISFKAQNISMIEKIVLTEFIENNSNLIGENNEIEVEKSSEDIFKVVVKTGKNQASKTIILQLKTGSLQLITIVE